jgi:DNA invertase Pin-like site-specific DNA recombinase
LLLYSSPRGLEKRLGDLQGILARIQKTTPRQSGPSTVRNVRRRLGAETLAEITTKYQSGTTTTQLMADYSLSKSAVLKILKDAGASMRRQPMTAEQVSEAKRLRDEGLTIAEIAAELGLARESVRRGLKA